MNNSSEIRNGYLITDVRKRVWKIELEIFDWFSEICKKNNISHFLIGGSAIGAVRHGGFIPWDDDLDIGMLRSDFDAFLQVANEEHSEQYFIQYGWDNGNDCSTFLRIRDCTSTGVIWNLVNREMNHGIFIEIYPFDSVPANKILRKTQAFCAKFFETALDIRFGINSITKKGKVISVLTKPFSAESLWKKWIKICTKYEGSESEYVDTVARSCYTTKSIHLYKKSDVEETVEVSYENTIARLAKGNDTCLKIHFGDYMKLPPIEERGVHHNMVVYYDPDKPYTENLTIAKQYFAGNVNFSKL